MEKKRQELLRLYNLPIEELLKISAEHMTNNIEFCSLVNAKSGRCSQDCKYCAQSAKYQADIKEYPLISKEAVKKAALEAKECSVMRFAAVTSGRSPDEKDFDKILEYIDEINSAGLKSCASLGILTKEQAFKLKERGLNRYHHNINTCSSYYPNICTSHKWIERYNTCMLVKEAGMSLCCGVILGMGESIEHRIETALELAEIAPDSIPINILTPIKNTPFENYFDKIDEENVLRTLAVFKTANPKSVLRFCGGRMRLSAECFELALKNCAEGVMTGNYLTTAGAKPMDDIKTAEKLHKIILR